MGAIFRVNIIESENLLETLKDINGYEIIVTSLDTKNSIYDIEYNKRL